MTTEYQYTIQQQQYTIQQYIIQHQDTSQQHKHTYNNMNKRCAWGGMNRPDPFRKNTTVDWRLWPPTPEPLSVLMPKMCSPAAAAWQLWKYLTNLCCKWLSVWSSGSVHFI